MSLCVNGARTFRDCRSYVLEDRLGDMMLSIYGEAEQVKQAACPVRRQSGSARSRKESGRSGVNGIMKKWIERWPLSTAHPTMKLRAESVPMFLPWKSPCRSGSFCMGVLGSRKSGLVRPYNRKRGRTSGQARTRKESREQRASAQGIPVVKRRYARL